MAILVTAAVTLLVAPPAVAASAKALSPDGQCGLTAKNVLMCWGERAGDGMPGARLAPIVVDGVGSGVRRVADGVGWHRCVVMRDRTARCWGRNWFGEVGDGTEEERLAPVEVTALSEPVIQLSTGGSFTCALTAARGVKCWGSNDRGQLGDGTTVDRLSAVTVSGLGSGVAQISSANDHTCALTVAGGVKCWGWGYRGRLGDGDRRLGRRPVNVIGLASGVVQIAAGVTHTCALMRTGAVKCWGVNGAGEVGDGSFDEIRSVPVDVVGLAGPVRAIGAGGLSCAIIVTGRVQCWGTGVSGDGTLRWRVTPATVERVYGATRLGVGTSHACALTARGRVKCWGENFGGRLGDNSTVNRRRAVFVQRFGGIPTTTSIVSPADVGSVGEPVVFTARVAPRPPLRFVRFLAVPAAGTGRPRPISGCARTPIANGTARCRVTYSEPGTYRVAARYLGTNKFKTSRSPTLELVIE